MNNAFKVGSGGRGKGEGKGEVGGEGKGEVGGRRSGGKGKGKWGKGERWMAKIFFLKNLALD